MTTENKSNKISNKTPDKDEDNFTIDLDTSPGLKVPSVTKLLNRKSLENAPPPLPPASDVAQVNPGIPPPPPSKKITPPPFSLAKNNKTEMNQSAEQSTPGTSTELHVILEDATRISQTLPPDPMPELNTPKEDSSDIPQEICITLEEQTKIVNNLQPHPQNPQSPQKKIQPGKRKNANQIPQLIIWQKELIQSGNDPMGKGIALMIQTGAQCALFLAVAQAPEVSSLPHFISTAAVLSSKETFQDKLMIWTGLKWDPNEFPDLWKHLIKNGSLEFSPPGTQTQLTSYRNLIRAIFGIRPHEWLLLVRIGPANSCRGIVVFVSTMPLNEHMAEALPFFLADPTQTNNPK